MKWLELLEKNPEIARSGGLYAFGFSDLSVGAEKQYGTVYNRSSYTLKAEIYKDGKKIYDIPPMRARTGRVSRVPLVEGRGYQIVYYHLDGRVYTRRNFVINGVRGDREGGVDWDTWVGN